jgi:hypothetical protein
MNSEWRKSTYSQASGGACVEAGTDAQGVLVRDTVQAGGGPVLSVPAVAWSAFLTTIR